MKLAIWRTGHEIADRVASAFKGDHFLVGSECDFDAYDFHIGYGILRGMEDVFAKAKHWINIDRGYINPGHYDGYYRLSYKGTQQTFGFPQPDFDRLKMLGVVFENRPLQDGYVLVCPPTDHVKKFFKIPYWDWDCRRSETPFIRNKGDLSPIDWSRIKRVITYNSSVGWEAMRRDIPVSSNPFNSIIGAFEQQYEGLEADYREPLFGIMAALQFTLDEFRQDRHTKLLEHFAKMK